MSDVVDDPIVARSLLHSCYVEDVGGNTDAIVVSEIIETQSGIIRPNLAVYKSPQTKFWVTKPTARSHTDKKEFEKLELLDEFKVPYRDRDKYMHEALNGRFPRFLNYDMKRELQQSPYLYGGNITIEARTMIKYKQDLENSPRKGVPHAPTTGFFDIERSLLPDSFGDLPLMVFTAENKVFLTMKKMFMTEVRDGVRVSVSVDEIRQAAHDIIDPLVASIFAENEDLKDYRDRLPFEYHFHVGETEAEMIEWIFGKMHETEVSFIGIWNLGFDIPEIIAALEKAKIPLENVFSHPKFRGTGFAYASYREDPRKVAHITQKWHWMSATAHFQFVDSMSLYSYIRVVDGKEASYALDDILAKFGLGGKLKIEKTKELEGLQQADWHRAMLSKFFVSYALYAMWDGMGLQLLEWRNNDLTSMMTLGDITPAKFFVNQTIRVTNTLFDEHLKQGWVLGTGVDVEGMADEDLLTEGGAVLEPQDLIARGLKPFIEWPNHATHAYAWINDVDFSAQYPTNTSVLNISKQTKVATMLNITGAGVGSRYKPKEAVEVLCSYLITPETSGYDLGVEFFNLPNYDEIDALFEEHLATEQLLVA
jgi:hypothetical protein